MTYMLPRYWYTCNFIFRQAGVHSHVWYEAMFKTYKMYAGFEQYWKNIEKE